MAGFGGMGFVGDILGGFNQEADRQRQQNAQEADRQAQRDNAVFESLANSEDPEVRSAAVTGLLTGNHPARGLDAFFGKVQQHPVHGQIAALLQQGHPATLGATQTAENHAYGAAAGGERGKVGGAVQAYSDVTGAPPDDETMKRIITPGYARQSNPRLGNAEIYNEQTGAWEPQAVTEHGGLYYDAQGAQITTGMRNWRANAPAGGAAGAHQISSKMLKSTVGALKASLGDRPEFAGHKDDEEVLYPADPVTGQLREGGQLTFPPPRAPSFSGIPTTNGIAAFDNHSGKVGPAQGGAGVMRPETPQAAAGDINQQIDQIIKLAPNTAPKYGRVRPQDEAATKAKRDELARQLGPYRDFADLLSRRGAAGSAVQQAVPGGPPQPRTPVAPGGAAPPPGAPKKGARVGGRSGDPVVDAVLDQLR